MNKITIGILVIALFLGVFLVSEAKGKSTVVNFEEVYLEDVISYMRDTTNLNFHVNWKALAFSGIDRKTPITLKLKNVKRSRILDLLCNQLNSGKDILSSVYWVVDRNVVTMTTGSMLDNKMEQRVYDVSDLLLIVPNFRGPRIEMNVGENSNDKQSKGLFDDVGGGGKDDDKNRYEEDPIEMRKKIRATLKNIIIESIGPSMWKDGGGKGGIVFLRNQMIVSQSRLGFILLKQSNVL